MTGPGLASPLESQLVAKALPGGHHRCCTNTAEKVAPGQEWLAWDKALNATWCL